MHVEHGKKSHLLPMIRQIALDFLMPGASARHVPRPRNSLVVIARALRNREHNAENQKMRVDLR
jgi:hypothetical protein